MKGAVKYAQYGGGSQDAKSIQRIDSETLLQMTLGMQFVAPPDQSTDHDSSSENRSLNPTMKGASNSYTYIKEKRDHLHHKITETAVKSPGHASSITTSESAATTLSTQPTSLPLRSVNSEESILCPTPPPRPKKDMLTRFSQIYHDEPLSQSQPSLPEAVKYSNRKDSSLDLLESNSLSTIRSSASLKKAFKVFQEAERKSARILPHDKLDQHSDSEVHQCFSLPSSAKKKLLLSRLEMEQGLINLNKDAGDQAWVTTVSTLPMARKYRAKRGAFAHSLTDSSFSLKNNERSSTSKDPLGDGVENCPVPSPADQDERIDEASMTSTVESISSAHGHEGSKIPVLSTASLPSLSDTNFIAHSSAAEKLISFHHKKQVTRQHSNHSTESGHAQELHESAFSNAEKAFSQALHYLSQEDWQDKIKGLSHLQRLAKYHPKEQLSEILDIHQMVFAVAQECKNLRSQVARMAVDTFTTLVTHLGKMMDPELELCVGTLLQKVGESNSFIRDEAEACLVSIVENTTSYKAAQALLQAARHKNGGIRKTCSMLLASLSEKMGPSKLLQNSHRDFTDKFLITVAELLGDGNTEARYYARKIFHNLMDHSDFLCVCQRSLPQKMWNKVKVVVENLRAKGLGDLPSSTPAASVSHMENSSKKNSLDSQSAKSFIITDECESPTSSPFSPPSSPDDGQITSLCDRVASSDQRIKLNALKQLEGSLIHHKETYGKYVEQVLHVLVPCLSNHSGKVVHQTVKAFRHFLPILLHLPLTSWETSLTAILHSVIVSCSMDDGLDTAALAEELLSDIVRELDGNLLIPLLVQESELFDHHMQPLLLSTISQICRSLSHQASGVVLTHVLPQIWKCAQLFCQTNSVLLKEALAQMIQAAVLVVGRYTVQQFITRLSHEEKDSSNIAQFLTSLLDENS